MFGMKVTVSLDLKRINIKDIRKKRTVKKNRIKYLNIYKKFNSGGDKNKEDFYRINLKRNMYEDLTIGLKQFEAQKLGLQSQDLDYEPILEFYPLTPLVSQYIEKMSLLLHLLVQDDDYLLKIKYLYEIETEPTSKILAEEKYKNVKRMFLESTKDYGKKFFRYFKKIYEPSRKKSNLMSIFVEVIKSQMRRVKGEIKKPISENIKLSKDLIHRMSITNGFKDFDAFFQLTNFEELFNKAYSLSSAANLESPISVNTPCASPSTSSTSGSQNVGNPVYLNSILT